MAEDSGDSGGSTIGVWNPEDSDVVDKFDKVVGNRVGPANYSRSGQILESMAMYTMIMRFFEERDWPEMGPRDRRAAVRQALIDMDRRDRE